MSNTAFSIQFSMNKDVQLSSETKEVNVSVVNGNIYTYLYSKYLWFLRDNR